MGLSQMCASLQCISGGALRRMVEYESTRRHLTGAARALRKRASTWLGPRGLAIGLVGRGPQVLHGVLPDLGPRPLKETGLVAAEDRLQAGKVHQARVIQLPPEGANREHHVVGLC